MLNPDPLTLQTELYTLTMERIDEGYVRECSVLDPPSFEQPPSSTSSQAHEAFAQAQEAFAQAQQAFAEAQEAFVLATDPFDGQNQEAVSDETAPYLLAVKP
jgi:hypothetical protein